MANRWFTHISELAEQTQKEVTNSPQNWRRFLTTASRFYKSYDFDDQLLIYAQRPNATACAEIDVWNNKMHRWVNAGSSAIGLIRKGTGGKPYIQNVHDVADTHPVRGGKNPWLWKMDEGRYVFTGETHLDRPNLLELTGQALEKELVRRQQTKGYKVLTELPLCENGVGMFNQTRNTLFLYLEDAGEYRRITPEDYDVNHVNVRPGQVLFTAFPFRDVKPVTEGMYRWDAERNETETLITPDKYSIDYVVTTSGLGGFYPGGLVIGTVESVRTGDDGLAQYAVLAPAARLGELSEVFIIKDFDIVD